MKDRSIPNRRATQPVIGAAQSGCAYSERGRHRLRIAAKLMRVEGVKLRLLGDEFYPRVMQEINALDDGRRERLLYLVDWVEAYEKEEA
jgi:hypothetical protein